MLTCNLQFRMEIKTTSFHNVQIICENRTTISTYSQQILEGFLPYAYKLGTIYTLTQRFPEMLRYE